MESNRIWDYSKDWSKIIKAKIEKENIDVVHIHGVWMYPKFIAAKLCFQNNIPFIITPHGMYEP